MDRGGCPTNEVKFMCRRTQQSRLYKPFCFQKTGAKWSLWLQFEKVLLNMPVTVCANEFAPSAHAAHFNALFTLGRQRRMRLGSRRAGAEALARRLHSYLWLRRAWDTNALMLTHRFSRHITHNDSLCRLFSQSEARHEESCPQRERSTGRGR